MAAPLTALREHQRRRHFAGLAECADWVFERLRRRAAREPDPRAAQPFGAYSERSTSSMALIHPRETARRQRPSERAFDRINSRHIDRQRR
jgi:hypothetical protein